MGPHEKYYARLIGRRRRRARGFRLNANRFSVRRLRAKLLTFLGLVGRYVRLLVRGLSGGSPDRSGSRRVLLVGGKDRGSGQSQPPSGQPPAAKARPKASYMRSNSFYAQAIAECLEFIKRNSVPVEDYGSVSARR